MRTLWRGICRTLFWSYERGSWPYDAMVIAILIFVLLTPRRWFNDQPLTPPPTAHADTSVQLIAHDDLAKTRTYRVSASMLPTAKRAKQRSPELEEQTHEVLGRSVEDLKGRTFQVGDIQVVRGEDGSVNYYDVSVKL
jgi:hypothetical protein